MEREQLLNRKSLVSLSSDLQFKISRELQPLNISVLNLLFLNLSVCYGIWGQFRANTLCYFAHLCYFADLCTSLLLCRSNFPEPPLQVPAFSKHLTGGWKAATRIIWYTKFHHCDGHSKTIFLFEKAKVALADRAFF